MTEPRGSMLDPEATADVVRTDARALVSDAFERYHVELLSFLRRTTRHDDDADDALQETFVRLTREVSAGRTPEYLRAWLYRVASNLAVSRGRRRSTVVRWFRDHAPSERGGEHAPSPESDVLRRERTSELDALLATLGHEARAALLLSSEGFTGLEIAEAIGRSHAATRTLLTRTRVKLRLGLEQREGPG